MTHAIVLVEAEQPPVFGEAERQIRARFAQVRPPNADGGNVGDLLTFAKAYTGAVEDSLVLLARKIDRISHQLDAPR